MDINWPIGISKAEKTKITAFQRFMALLSIWDINNSNMIFAVDIRDQVRADIFYTHIELSIFFA